MPKDESRSESDRGLRSKAEKRLSERPKKEPSRDPNSLIHELEVHQIELEMQNEDLRRAQLEVEASRQKYFEFYDVAPVGYLTLNEKGMVLELNLTAAKLLGIERKSLVNKPFSRFIPPESQDAFYFHSREVLRSSTKQSCELALRKDDGTLFYAQLDSIGLDLGGQRVIRTVLTDITERKRAEEALLQEKASWERTFASVPDLIAIIDDQHQIQRVNEAMARRLGVKAEEIIGLNCYKLVHGLSEPPDYCPHSRTIKDGRQHIEEVHDDRLGGYFMVSTTPLHDDQGQMIGAVHVAHDITERKKAEEALQQSRERLQVLAEATFEGIALSEAGRILETNDQLARMIGYRKDELIGMEAASLFFPEDRARLVDNIRMERESTTEHRLIRKDGVVITVEAHGKPFTYEGRHVRVTALRDITERKKAETNLAADLAALTRMHALSTKVLEEGGIQPLLQEIMDSAVAIMGAQKGTMQLLGGNSPTLSPITAMTALSLNSLPQPRMWLLHAGRRRSARSV